MQTYLKHKFSIEDSDLVSVIDELPLWSAPFGLKLLENVEMFPNMTVLDVGCGLGFPMIEMAQRLGEDSRVWGIDPWKKALDRAAQKIKKFDINNAYTILAPAEKIPFKDKSFDLIISNNGINNVNNIHESLLECNRVCKNNGRFLFTMNLEESMIEFYGELEQVLVELSLPAMIDKMKDQIYEKRKPISEIKSMLLSAGFSISKILFDDFSLRFANASAFFNHSTIKYWFLPGWKKIMNDDSILGRVFGCLEEKLNKIADEKGSLSLSIPFVTIECLNNN